ncbi:hypothetical protein SAMN05892877_103388 [Rhizobium subbaraonis]|uniref:Uncharacterized protein n=1 Tax=Rhizobium subbaraonis TaxID=908946 RepID=A0A285U518_9HYPH|nr:hypothetical protein [Rhizobium subbaraonis]SOC37044.1 hypothetical protein SAMN05892877_103388 [Rhizobium subbaraonis]
MTNKLAGTLEYLRWDHPWKVTSAAGDLDLSPPFWEAAQIMQGHPAVLSYTRDSFTLALDESAEHIITMRAVGEGILLTRKDGDFGFQNVLAYAEDAFIRLNGRRIIATIDADRFDIIADPFAPPVPDVNYFGSGNMGRIPDPMPCRPGDGAETCIFLVGGPSGFECAKFSSIARTVLSRKADGTMRAGRIGNCRLNGREGAH